MDETRVLMKYRLPLAEVVTDFYDELKSRTSGYATFDYEENGYEVSDLVKVCCIVFNYPIGREPIGHFILIRQTPLDDCLNQQ
jgi:translation elongation factor EF-4